MTSASTPELSSVRQRLTKMTDRLLMRLHDRAGFPLNRPVYEPGGVPVPGREDISLFSFAIEGLESYHASLGRFEHADQFPLSEAGRPRTPTPDERVQIALREDLEGFYTREVLPRLCEDAVDPESFGETAYVDADLLELLNERIHIGRDIALAKVAREPDLWEIVQDDERLSERLTDKARERAVIEDAGTAAERYGLDRELSTFVFEWIIARTLKLEVEYLQRLAPAT